MKQTQLLARPLPKLRRLAPADVRYELQGALIQLICLLVGPDSRQLPSSRRPQAIICCLLGLSEQCLGMLRPDSVNDRAWRRFRCGAGLAAGL